MRRWRSRIAHFYLPGPYLIGANVALAAGTPIKVMSRRSLSGYQRNWPTVVRLERRLHGQMDAVIGNSRAVIRELIDEGVPEAKIRLRAKIAADSRPRPKFASGPPLEL